MPGFHDTSRITFTQRGHDQPEQTLVVDDLKEVQRFVSTLRLTRKQPCPCSHNYEVTFITRTEEIKVSICNHCFDVLGAKNGGWYRNVRYYSMPEDFYTLFRNLALSRTNENWDVPPLAKRAPE